MSWRLRDLLGPIGTSLSSLPSFKGERGCGGGNLNRVVIIEKLFDHSPQRLPRTAFEDIQELLLENLSLALLRFGDGR
jgi:hypothetical protein